MRHTKKMETPPITEATFTRLLELLTQRYPGQWWRVVEVCPDAVVKTIDNEVDALETIRRLEARLAEEA